MLFLAHFILLTLHSFHSSQYMRLLFVEVNSSQLAVVSFPNNLMFPKAYSHNHNLYNLLIRLNRYQPDSCSLSVGDTEDNNKIIKPAGKFAAFVVLVSDS
jgi:hypothetical protein